MFNFFKVAPISDLRFMELEISRWLASPQRKLMLDGERYYLGDHDILKRKRTVIGRDGVLTEVKNLPNNKIVDNQYSKLVDQKTNYLLGKELTLDTDDKKYQDALGAVFTPKFHKLLKNIGGNSLNCGIGWLMVNIDNQGQLRFTRLEPYEVLPFWSDSDHTQLDVVCRLYEQEEYIGEKLIINYKVELYYPDRIERYDWKDGRLKPDDEIPQSSYMIVKDDSGELTSYGWGRIPIIPFKYNNREVPLIKKLKSLQDSINMMISDFENNMQEDSRNTILIIKNYDGENLADFRHNLSTYGAVKVTSRDGADGGVEALQVEVNAENYKSILQLLKNAIVENAMGFDAKSDKLLGNPNQMNIQSMYSDIELDANNMELEYQASLHELLELLNIYFVHTGVGDFEKSKVTIIFNRDMMMNESEVIEACGKSLGVLSKETVISQHPWVTDIARELDRKEKENNVEQTILA